MGAPLSILVLGLAQRSGTAIVVALVLAVAATLPLLDLLATMWWIGVRVTVTDEGIRTRSYLRRVRHLAWPEVVERREFDVHTSLWGNLGNVAKQVRLVGRSGRVIAISGDLPGFDELHEIIRSKTAHAVMTGDTRSWWRRLTCRIA